MKFFLQLEVEAPENTNENFPKAVHAIQWLQDQLKLASMYRLKLQNAPAYQKQVSSESWGEYIKYQEANIEMIDEAILTVREREI